MTIPQTLRDARLNDLATRFSNVGMNAHSPRWLFDQLTRPDTALSSGEAAHRLMIGEALAAGNVPVLLDALRAHAIHAEGMQRCGFHAETAKGLNDAAGLTPDLCPAFWNSSQHEIETLIESMAIRPAPDHARLLVLSIAFSRASFREALGVPVLPSDMAWADGILDSASADGSDASQSEIELAGEILQRADSGKRPIYLAG